MSIRNRVGTDVGKVKKSDIYMWILLGVFAGYVGICLSNTFVEGEISLERLGEIGEIALHPGQLCINDKILPCIGGSLLVWIMAFNMELDDGETLMSLTAKTPKNVKKVNLRMMEIEFYRSIFEWHMIPPSLKEIIIR